MDPGDAQAGIGVGDGQAGFGSVGVYGEVQPAGEVSLN
jgi:hypothetical protein